MSLTEEQFQRSCKHFGITEEEGRRREAILKDHGDNPEDPICVGCARRPHEIQAYVDATFEEELSVLTEHQQSDVRIYVIMNEGTLNRTNGHFLCDACYIMNGMPSSDRGWTCP